jgi:hypothetical protein
MLHDQGIGFRFLARVEEVLRSGDVIREFLNPPLNGNGMVKLTPLSSP